MNRPFLSMGRESYTCSSGVDSGGHRIMGNQRELSNIRGAQLYLIDGEESVLMTSGEFSLKLLKQTHSPLAVVVANVGEVQWPVGKDAPVLKVWNRRYTFALPGLVYGMILPDTTQVGALQLLDSNLAEFGAFETHHEITDTVQLASNGWRENSSFWTSVAQPVETLSSRVARNIDSTSTIVANSIVRGGDWAALSIRHGASSLTKRKSPDSSPTGRDRHDEGQVSPRMMNRMQQARRMSAVAKLLSRTLLKGAISATSHISETLGIDGSYDAPESGPIYSPLEVATPQTVAIASVDAFGKVVEAVETAGKSLYNATFAASTDIVHDRFGSEAGQALQDGLGAFGSAVNTAWTLNKRGVRMLLRMTAASAFVNSRSSAASGNTSPAGDNNSGAKRVPISRTSESDRRLQPCNQSQ